MNRRLYSEHSRFARCGSSHTQVENRSCSWRAFSCAASVFVGLITGRSSTVSVTTIRCCETMRCSKDPAGISGIPQSLVA